MAITRDSVRHLQQQVKLYHILTEQVQCNIHKPVTLFLHLDLFRIGGPIGIFLKKHINKYMFFR